MRWRSRGEVNVKRVVVPKDARYRGRKAHFECTVQLPGNVSRTAVGALVMM
jgi:hypothetical protein